MKKLYCICLLVLSWLITPSIASTYENTPLKVGFLFIGSTNDDGWNYAHNQGRLFLETAMKGKVKTEFAENIPDSADCERVMEKMIAGGDRVIFTTSYGFLEHVEKLAVRHPEIIFIHLARKSNCKFKNLGTCITYHWEPMYIAGMVAGNMTKTNQLGIVAAHSVPQVLQTVNAFALGAKSVNPKVKVHIVWTNTWYDPPLESEAARSLIDDGVDVLTMHENTPSTILRLAEQQKVFCVGFHTNLEQIAPNYWLTGESWNWGPLYADTVQSILNNTWKAGNKRFDMKSGYVGLSPFGKRVPSKVKQEAYVLTNKITSGKLNVFAGPMVDNKGKQIIAAGKELSQIDGMDWLVSGIEAALPSR